MYTSFFAFNFFCFCVLSVSGWSDCSFNETVPHKFFNKILDKQNPSSFCPVKTDDGGGGLPPFKYPFSFSRRAMYSGGWTRQVTESDLKISIGMAGVQMRLIKGGIRELHWHAASEWAYMIYGHARITAVDQLGRAFVDDVKAHDLWLFPGGIPHSIQGIGDDGALFVLVFNDGNFDEFKTFLLTDWMINVPKDILAKNFQVNESKFSRLPKHPPYMFAASLPEPLKVERKQITKKTGSVPQSYAFYTNEMEPNVTRNGGSVKIVDANNFPVTDIAAAIVTLKPGGLRELHWHPNADEWQYYVTGYARMGVFSGGGEARTMDFQAGDVGYISKSVPHYVENIGKEDLIFLEVFPHPYYQDVSLAQWLAHTPPVLVNEHIKTGTKFINSIDKSKVVIQP